MGLQRGLVWRAACLLGACVWLLWGGMGCRVIHVKKQGNRSKITVFQRGQVLRIPSFSSKRNEALVLPFAGRSYGAGDLIPLGRTSFVSTAVHRRDVAQLKRTVPAKKLFLTPVIWSSWVNTTLQIARDWSARIVGFGRRGYEIKKVWLDFLFRVDHCNLRVAGHSTMDRCPVCGIPRHRQSFVSPGSRQRKTVFWVRADHPHYARHRSHVLPYRNCPADWRRAGGRALLRFRQPPRRFEEGCQKGGARK